MIPILHIQNLAIGRKQALISGINCEIGKGELVILTGVNGCGKSTLLKTIAGLLLPLSGIASINGIILNGLPARESAKLLAFVHTARIHEDYITVREMIAFGRYPFGSNIWNDTKTNALVDECIRLMRIEHIASKYLNTISDGEWQKANVCRALVQDTPLILMDEPTAFLDYPSKIQLFKDLKEIAVSRKKVIILSTHDIDLAIQYGSMFWHVSQGMMQSANAPLPWT